ncbi:alpha/beta hydrolase fold [Nonomuraea solani]|uniref:Alpha/beta hydrolase fold n=1 Tax=Nonomuraea solani TaxID=1144553 RepID=A0A1H5TKR7_9ACTN|nr:alpha/beta fold hydrolase [Nonomuraea solani]SEF63389.1 alpha/beta hydrolase fold [Nonomuraea solani]
MPLARSNGFKIAYEVSGDGPPVVLHPGMFQDGAHWAHRGYTAALTGAYTVIAIDPLGLGSSDAPHEIGAYALERRVDCVMAVLDDAGAERAAFWGYSLGAMTGYAVAAYAPERLTCLVAGAFDPMDGFRSAVDQAIQALGLPADVDAYEIMKRGAYTDPYQAALIDGGDLAAFRANYDAFSREPGLHTELATAGVAILMYAGTTDPWHEPMRAFATGTGSGFFSVSGADHKAGWDSSADVLPQVLPFLGAHTRT